MQNGLHYSPATPVTVIRHEPESGHWREPPGEWMTTLVDGSPSEAPDLGPVVTDRDGVWGDYQMAGDYEQIHALSYIDPLFVI